MKKLVTGGALRAAGLRAIAFAFLLPACHAGVTTRVNSYTPYGQFQPGESQRVSDEYAKSMTGPVPDWNVTILNSSLPPGMAMMNGRLLVAADAPYEVLGQFEIGFRLDDSAPTQAQLPAYLKRFAKAAHADILVIQIQQRQDRPDKVAFVEGFAIRTKQDAKPSPTIDPSGSTQI